MENWSSSHRQFPIPNRPWVMKQSWMNLGFIHWPVPIHHIESMIPAELTLDTFEGQAWISLVPLRIVHMHARFVPAFGFHGFPEVNLRTYVVRDGRPGVFFFRLDAEHRLVAALGRRFLHVPYHDTSIHVDRQDEWIHYRLHPSGLSLSSSQLEFTIRPVSDVFESSKHSIDSWLTDRYCFYTTFRGRVYRGDIHHGPWALQTAEVAFHISSALVDYGFGSSQPVLAHFSRQQEVQVWPLTRS
ncbi:YqjF family protein [Alicyclobacillus dauci]|uniref:DUF2071 domain-containing protein n=1 Tax=Alicyclobacillus dauci TaxID=1475485 RepID=A0ABY6YXE5_9BACL|nr:DUF2071 domain-containing protein [Alicyclobacillus dauci]WAH35277.1 DUF2071 domain-containing protein [Alicyclobacillus dauci]